MSEHDSIFRQSIRIAALKHRAEEDERLRQLMADDLTFRLRYVPAYESILQGGKEMKTYDLLDQFDPFTQASKHGIGFADAIREILPYFDGVCVYSKENTLTWAKVIVNGPATVLFIEGKKYVAKCHDEPFDITKGILVCIVKYSGFSYSHIKSWLKQHGLEGSQDAELCHLWDISEAMGFSKEDIKKMGQNAKYEVKIERE